MGGPWRTDAQAIHLHEAHDGVVVVELGEVQVPRATAGAGIVSFPRKLVSQKVG